MKTFLKFTVFSAVLLMLAGVAVSCDRDNDKELYIPFGTFKFYLNGELFEGFDRHHEEEHRRDSLLQAFYFPGIVFGDPPSNPWEREWGISSRLRPSSHSLISGIYFVVDFSGVGKQQPIHLALDANPAYRVGHLQLFDNRSSWVIITKLDTINMITEGTFQMIGQYYLFDNEKWEYVLTDIRITNGRFNLPLLFNDFRGVPGRSHCTQFLPYTIQSLLLESRIRTPKK